MNENILIFDTETIDIQKCFAYNIGWVIRELETGKILEKKDYVVKQFWENKALFETAYYAKKKQLYVGALRSRKAIIKYYGFVMQDMIRDIEKYEIKTAYAFNSPFDIRVFDFNSEWFKCSNALDYVKTIDIRGLLNDLIISKEYKEFCLKNDLLTPANNLQVNAESIYKFITNNPDFAEEHTALSDSIIESDIIFYLKDLGIDIFEEKKVINVVNSEIERTMIIDHKGEIYNFDYSKKTTRKGTLFLK